jgi:hypothetical protein
MSGIIPSDEAKDSYQKVKMGKSSFGVFCIEGEKTVECKHLGDLYSGDTAGFAAYWANVVAYAEENLAASAAYIISEFRYEADGRDQNKMALISWCPENKLKVKMKMLHGSTLNAIKQSFDGLQGKAIQAAAFADLDFESVKAEINSL